MAVKKVLKLQKRKELLHGLDKQNVFYQRILELGDSLIATLEEKGSLFDLAPILKKKKIFLSCINEIEQKIQEQKTDFRKLSSIEDPVDGKIQTAISLQEDLLQKSIEQEDKSQNLLKLVQAALLKKKQSLEEK